MSQKPICDRCGRPVESFSELRDDFMGRTRFTARCHGESETIEVHDDEIPKGQIDDIGRAFARPKALPAPRLLRLFPLLGALLLSSACSPSTLPQAGYIVTGERVRLVRVSAECEAAYGHRIYDALAYASDYWAERGHPPLEFTNSHLGVPVTCPKEWPDGSTAIKGRASRWSVAIRDEALATDATECRYPRWNLSRVVTHEIGHMHGLGHTLPNSRDIMYEFAATYCELPD